LVSLGFPFTTHKTLTHVSSSIYRIRFVQPLKHSDQENRIRILVCCATFPTYHAGDESWTSCTHSLVAIFTTTPRCRAINRRQHLKNSRYNSTVLIHRNKAIECINDKNCDFRKHINHSRECIYNLYDYTYILIISPKKY